MSQFITYKHGLKVLNVTPQGDAGLAMNQNFSTLGDLFDAVPLIVGSKTAGDALVFDSGGNVVDSGITLGTAASHAATDFDTAGSAASAQAASLQKSANLSDLASASTARTNLGLSNSATITATNANTPSTIVERDPSGNFSAGTITATFAGALAGHASLDLPLTGGTVLSGAVLKQAVFAALGVQLSPSLLIPVEQNDPVTSAIGTNPSVTQLFNPQLWLDTSAIVGANGSRPGTIPDRSGHVRDATGGSMQLVAGGQNGLNYLSGDGTDRTYYTPNFLDSSYDTSCTAIAVCAMATSTDAFNVQWSTGDGHLYQNRSNAGGSTPLLAVLESGGTLTSPSHIYAAQTDGSSIHTSAADLIGVQVSHYNGSVLRTGFNGIFNGSPASGNLSLSGLVEVGKHPGGFPTVGNFYELLIWNQALTLTQINTVMAYLAVKWGITPRRAIICDGNSQTAGTNTNGEVDAFPYQLQGMYPTATGPIPVNFGVPSRNTDAMIAQAPNSVDWCINSLSNNPVLVYWDTINQYAQDGQSLSDTQTKAQTYLAGRRAAGYRRIVSMTATPEDPSISAPTPNWATVFRAPMIAWWQTQVGSAIDVLVRLDLHPVIGPDAAGTNTALFGDGIHPTRTAHTAIAQMLTAALPAMVL